MSLQQQFTQLAEQGDVRAIKRLYAQQLKVTRPDDDADAFQQLHQTYQWALGNCAGATGPQDSAGATAAEPAAAVSVAPSDQAHSAGEATTLHHTPQVVRVDCPLGEDLPDSPDAAVDQLLALSDGAGNEQFHKHVMRCMRQWPLDNRWAVGKALYHRLHNESPALPAGHVHVLAHVMGWDDVVNGMDPMEIHWLASRAEQKWLLAPGQGSQLRAEFNLQARHRNPKHKDFTGKQVAALLGNLKKPLPAWRHLLMSLWPNRSQQYRHLLDALRHPPHTTATPPLEARTVSWLDRSQTAHTREQLSLTLCRCLIMAMVIGLTPGLLYLHGGLILTAASAAKLVAGCVVAGVGLFALLTGYRALRDWQTQTEASPSRHRILRFLALPLLCLGTAASVYALPVGGLYTLGVVLAGLLQAVALARLGVRRGKLVELNQIAALAIFMGSLTVFPGLAIALLIWGWDAWKHRKQLNFRSP